MEVSRYPKSSVVSSSNALRHSVFCTQTWNYYVSYAQDPLWMKIVVSFLTSGGVGCYLPSHPRWAACGSATRLIWCLYAQRFTTTQSQTLRTQPTSKVSIGRHCICNGTFLGSHVSAGQAYCARSPVQCASRYLPPCQRDLKQLIL